MLTIDDYMDYKKRNDHDMCTRINVMLDMFCFLMVYDPLTTLQAIQGYSLPNEYNGILATIVEKVNSGHVNSYGAFLCEILLVEECRILSRVGQIASLSIHPNLKSAR